MWSAYLFETITGTLGPRLPLAAAGSWQDGPINDATAAEVTVPTRTLLGLERWQWAPRSGGVVVCFTDPWGDLHPIVAGPILGPPSGDREMSTLRVGGLWSLLDGRVVTDRDYGPAGLVARTPDENTEGGGPLPDTSDVVDSTVAFQGMSLGTIGWRLVEYAQQRPMGHLPVVHGSPVETAAAGADRQRTYEGWNLANNSVGKRLRELTEVIGGPDIAFRPRWADPDQGRIEWVMVHGTEAMPEIDQAEHPVIDLSAPRPWGTVDRITAEAHPVDRVYSTGAGEGRGTLARIVQRPPQDRTPWAEAVVTNTEAVNPDIVIRDGQTRLADTTIVQIAVTAAAADRAMPLHKWNTGDAMTVIVPDGYPQLPAGAYRSRVVSRSGDFVSQMVRVEFQPEEMLLW